MIIKLLNTALFCFALFFCFSNNADAITNPKPRVKHLVQCGLCTPWSLIYNVKLLRKAINKNAITINSCITLLNIFVFEYNAVFPNGFHLGYRGILPNAIIGYTHKKHNYSGLIGLTKTGFQYAYDNGKKGSFFIYCGFNALLFSALYNDDNKKNTIFFETNDTNPNFVQKIINKANNLHTAQRSALYSIDACIGYRWEVT